MSDPASGPDPGPAPPAAVTPTPAVLSSSTVDSSTPSLPAATATVTITAATTPQVAMATTAAQPVAVAAAQTAPVPIATTLTQLVGSSSQVVQASQNQAPTAGAVIRSSLPQGTVQLIQGTPFVQQQYMQQQQYYIQSVQGNIAMQGQPVAQQVNLTPVQGRPASTGAGGQKSPIISIPQSLPHGTVTLKTVSPSVTTVTGTQTAKGGKSVVQQPTMISKQLLGRPGQPLVIPMGQLGVLSNAAGNQTLVAQPKSPSVSLGSQGAVLNSPTQIRFTNAPTFMTSQGQILSTSPAMLNQIQMATIQPNTLPLGTQQVLGPQSAIIGTQPLYLRPAGIQTQQGIVGSVQAVLPNKGLRQTVDNSNTVQMKSTGTQVKTVTPAQVKGVANILPQTARPLPHVPGSPTLAKGVQTAQIKQVSRVRALKPQVKAATVAQVIPGQPAKIAPQQVGTARLLTPAMTRPPTLLVQPKPHIPAVTSVKPVLTPSSTPPQVVTLVTTVPVTTVMQTQRQTPPITVVTSPQKPAQPTTVSVATVAVTPIKAEPEPPVLEKSVSKDTTMADDTGRHDDGPATPGDDAVMEADKVPKPEEPMETDSPAVTTVTPATAPTDTPAAPAPQPHAPPPLRPPADRSDRVATVIGERQAAIVKPNVLTHVIEGFVIQEAPEPFPVQRCSALADFIPGRASEQDNDSALEKDFSDSSGDTSGDSKEPDGGKAVPSLSPATDDPHKLKCEFCGKVDNAKRFRSSGRFCSRSCAKRYNVGCTRRLGQFKSRKRSGLTIGSGVRRHKVHPMKKIWKRSNGGRVSTGPIQRNPEAPTLTSALTLSNVRSHSGSVDGTDMDTDLGIGMSGLGAPSTISMETTTTTTTTSSESERSTSPSAHSSSPRSPPELQPEMDLDTMGSHTPIRPINTWTVQEVVDFVRNLPGCDMYADEFNRQEIDGQALMLLKEDHLMTTMSIKLGPALKICNKINSLKEEGL